MSVLEVHDVSIRYITGDFKDIGLKEYVMKKLKGQYEVTEFWADRHVSFTLEKGEMLGIIGTNGAGKSTLLKAVSGIMEPSEGCVHREGNVAALLELASGFDGDLTVKENAYLRGAMLGYTRKFMDETYDQIIEFAELQDFQDRPFRQLSSGMKSRLAFSIASLVQPDILILDEVLSVGDGAFRKKSEAKMREIIAGGAATILVSHSVSQVRELCTKVLWLDHGKQIALSENVEAICDLYQCFLNGEISINEASKQVLLFSAKDKTWANKTDERPITKEIEDKVITDNKQTETVAEQMQQAQLREKMAVKYKSNCNNGINEKGLTDNRTDFSLKNWLSKEFRFAFLAACIIGAITHLYVFTNLILNHDSVWRLYYDNDNLASGRWLLQAISDISTRFQTPIVIGLISILAIALSAALTIEILGIKNPISIVLTSGILITFPSVACIFSYMFTADAYFVALLFNTLAVYLTKKYRLGWLPGIVLLTLACGIYQAFICYAIGLFVFDCTIMFFSDEKIEKVVLCGLKYIIMLLTALVSYYAILNILLRIKNVKLTSYQGFSGMSIGNIGAFIKEIPKAYRNYVIYFIKSPYLSSFYQLVQTVLIVAFLINCVILIIKERIYRDPLRLWLIILTLALIPLALNFITVLSVGADVHALMIYSFSLQFAFAIKMVSMAAETIQHSDRAVISIITTILCGLLLWNNFCISNTVYLRLQVTYENSYALANRIVARVEALDGYNSDIPVAVVGEASRKLFGGTVAAFAKLNSLTGTNDTLLYSSEPHHRTRYFINHYIGIRMPRPSEEQKNMLSESVIVLGMPSYPEEGSVAMVNGVIVIKLSDGPIR